MDFQKELTELLNKHGFDNEFNTPDFLLSEYLISCLMAYEKIKKYNDDWHKSDEYREKRKQVEKALDKQMPGWRDI